MDGDGDEDAAVMYSTNTGGTGHFQDLAVMLNNDGFASYADHISLWDREALEDFRIENGVIFTDILTHADTDGLCCPSVPWTREFVYLGGIVEVLDEYSR